ncbi:ABC transporter ATP-binding protein [Virgibacillus alimentarius]|uniref:ABC transporter ATP-binding protein n=1 Tax=Virgibacillus alimentarius TaxID=698769 RepID=UPI0004936C34|nr:MULTISPECIES: ABC transporter ATP-binding protein [Virgibacillus]HLR69241.1 ABC transporter ATP-binding protein [Virgibacillus sp.]
MSKAVLEFKDVSFQYQEADKSVDLLDSLHFRVFDGEFISIIGASGSGKSTLFRLITGLEQPVSGSIHINGEQRPNRLGSVGYMPQQDLLMPWRTIYENAVLPLEIKGVSKQDAHQQVVKGLKEFGLSGYEQNYPSDLSGGMKQRVSFLRAVLSGSNILLLDEPFSALDAMTKLSMQEWLLAQWEKRGQTILFITHDVNEALFLSDRIFILTERPVKQLKEAVVPMNRPRTLSGLHAPEVTKMKEQLIEQLRERISL